MNTNQNSILNVGQAVVAIAKLVMYFTMPMIALVVPVMGEVFGLKGLDLYNWGHVVLCLVAMILYVVMLIFTLGPLQKISVIPAAAALVVEIIIMSTASGLIPISEWVAILNQHIPAEYASYVSMAEAILKTSIRPATGLIISMVLTLVYAVLQFFPIISIPGSSGNNSRPTPPAGGTFTPRV